MYTFPAQTDDAQRVIPNIFDGVQRFIPDGSDQLESGAQGGAGRIIFRKHLRAPGVSGSMVAPIPNNPPGQVGEIRRACRNPLPGHITGIQEVAQPGVDPVVFPNPQPYHVDGGGNFTREARVEGLFEAYTNNQPCNVRRVLRVGRRGVSRHSVTGMVEQRADGGDDSIAPRVLFRDARVPENRVPEYRLM